MVIFGSDAVQSLLIKQPERIQQLIFCEKNRQDEKLQTLIELAKQQQIKIAVNSRIELDRLVDQENHQGSSICHRQNAIL